MFTKNYLSESFCDLANIVRQPTQHPTFYLLLLMQAGKLTTGSHCFFLNMERFMNPRVIFAQGPR